MDRALALDVATRCGWAARLPDGAQECGTLDFTVGVPRRGRHPGLVLLNAHRTLTDLVRQVRPGIIVFERPFSRGAGTRILSGLCSIVELVGAQHGLATSELTAGQVRKELLGRGDSSKEEIEAFVREEGWRPDSLDASDAAGLLLAYESMMRPRGPRLAA